MSCFGCSKRGWGVPERGDVLRCEQGLKVAGNEMMRLLEFKAQPTTLLGTTRYPFVHRLMNSK
jgi:hypothetical protein